MIDNPCPYYGAWVIQCSTSLEVTKPLFRGARGLGPRYLANSIREANRTCLGHMTKLNRLCTLDPLSTSSSKEHHLVAQDLKQEKNHKPTGGVQVPQVGPPMVGLHSLNQEQSRGK
jgi:hypothetical protein